MIMRDYALSMPVNMNNYGYCCINLTLGKEGVTTNRTMRKATYQERGLQYVSQIALQNCTDLDKIIRWNEENGIKVFRISSELFPWASEYEFDQLPDIECIRKILHDAGSYAKSVNQRLSFHPGPFNVLASKSECVVKKALKELRFHGEIMDMLNQPNTTEAKINIHIGGAYGNRELAADSWCRNFESLQDSVKNRITVENDDKTGMFSTKMLYEWIYGRVGVPIVFDSHHFECGPQDSSYSEAFEMAYSTWGNVRPMCHHSNSRQHEELYSAASAHSDYYYKRFESCGKDVDVALECKAKELGLKKYLSDFESKPTFLSRYLSSNW
jgi:UV DNA damage endonuclease